MPPATNQAPELVGEPAERLEMMGSLLTKRVEAAEARFDAKISQITSHMKEKWPGRASASVASRVSAIQGN